MRLEDVRSPTLFAQGGTDPTGGYCIRTLSICRQTEIMGPILDTVAISRDVVGAPCKELGWLVNICLLRPFTVPVRSHHFTSSVVTARGYKAGDRTCVNLRPLA
jgi:hypothetical protein